MTPPKPQKQEARTLTSGEAKRLLRTARGEKLQVLYVLAVTTGMGQGELLGLKWDDIELDEGTLRVRRTLCEGKTTNANRYVRLTRIARGP